MRIPEENGDCLIWLVRPATKLRDKFSTLSKILRCHQLNSREWRLARSLLCPTCGLPSRSAPNTRSLFLNLESDKAEDQDRFHL